MSLSAQIESVNEKLQTLLKQYNSLQRENQRLIKENGEIRRQFEAKSQQAQQLQQKFEAIKLTSGEMNEDMKKDLEKRINGYLKEIDKCLNLLSD